MGRLDDLSSSAYAFAGAADGYGQAYDLDGAEWALVALGAAAVAAGVGAVIYAHAHPGAAYQEPASGGSSEDDGMDWFLNPANPLSPLSPVSPIWND